MSIKFSTLWVYWLGWVILDVFFVVTGLHPVMTPGERADQDITIAAFLLLVMLIEWAFKKVRGREYD